MCMSFTELYCCHYDRVSGAVWGLRTVVNVLPRVARSAPDFYPCDAIASAGISCRRLSVRLSHVSVLLKQLNVGSRTIAQGL